MFIFASVMEINTAFPVIFVILAEANSLGNSLKELRLDYVPPGYRRAAICEGSKCC